MSGVARAIPTAGEGPLKLAVPRGALLAGTLDLLDAIGVETSELQGDSRALVFDAGELTLVTMRPSDVPTYVEAGAADLGVTGKDVLAEQRDRVVYELLDLGFGGAPQDFSKWDRPASRASYIVKPDAKAVGGTRMVRDAAESDLAKGYTAPSRG